MIAAPGQRVARLCLFGARTLLSCQRKRLELERHRDVETPASLGHETLDGRDKPVERGEQVLVTHALAGRASKCLVDQRRLAVRDGIADDGITVHETSPDRRFSETAPLGAVHYGPSS